MTKQEFIEEVEKIDKLAAHIIKSEGKKFDDCWKEIECVYVGYPTISSGEAGKNQVARLYVEFGMLIIHDMLPRAQETSQKAILEYLSRRFQK